MSWQHVLIRWPKYWSFSFNISPCNEYWELISLRTDLFVLLAVQGTLKSPLQHHNLKASILRCSVFSMVHNAHMYMTIGKMIALTLQTFVSKVMSLLFNVLSRFVIAFLPRRMCLLISWLQLPSVVILEPKGEKWNLSLFPLFDLLFTMKWWDWMPWSSFSNVDFQVSVFTLLFNLHQEAL